MVMWLEKKWETTDEIIKEMKLRFKYSTFILILTDSHVITLQTKEENISDSRAKPSDKITSRLFNMTYALSW